MFLFFRNHWDLGESAETVELLPRKMLLSEDFQSMPCNFKEVTDPDSCKNCRSSIVFPSHVPCDPAIPLLGIYLKNWKQRLKRIPAHPCSQQPGSLSPKGKTSQGPVSRGVRGRTQCSLYAHNRTSLSLKKGRDVTTWINLMLRKLS